MAAFTYEEASQPTQKSFTFEEAQAPASFSFEEAQESPTIAPLPAPPGGSATPEEEQQNLAVESEGALGAISRGASAGMKEVGKAVSDVANLGVDYYNKSPIAQDKFGTIPRLEAGKPILPPAAGDLLERGMFAGLQGNTPGASPSGVALATGLAKAGRSTLEGFTTPEGAATLPLLEAKLGRAAMLAVSAAQTPAQIQNTVAVLQDDKATPAQKWEALGDSGASLLMTGALALGVTHDQLKANYSPEDVAKVVEQPKTPLEQQAETIAPIAPLTAEALKQTAAVEVPKVEAEPSQAANVEPTKPAPASVPNWDSLYKLEHTDLLDAQKRMEQAREDNNPEAESQAKQARDDIIQRLDQFDKLSQREGGDIKNPTADALHWNPEMSFAQAVDEGQRLTRMSKANEAYDAALESGDGKKAAAKVSQAIMAGNAEPLNPGGAQADLPPEQQATSKANNSRAAWGDFGGLNKTETPAAPAKEPWQMTREEYDKTEPKSDGQRDVLIADLGDSKVPIIKNPSAEDYQTLTQRHYKDFPDDTSGDPKTRFTIDSNGNRYVWPAGEAMHSSVEAWLKERGVVANQNTQWLSHRYHVARALLARKPVPPEVLKDYPSLQKEPIVDQPVNKSGEAVKDSNIGRSWNSPYGKQTITKVENWGGRDNYTVTTEKTGDNRIYSADQIESVIKRNEHEITPEYAAEQADAEEIRKLKQERDARFAAKAAKVESEITEFTKEQSPMMAAKTKAALLKQINAKGTIYTRKELVESEIAKGAKVITEDGKRRLEKPDGAFWDESTITKAAMDYAEHLSLKSDEPPAAAIIGMGGATPSEFERGIGTPTSNKNAIVDKERAERGLPPMMTTPKQSWDAAWTKAMAQIDLDSTWQDRLIEELNKKPRSITPEENMALLHRRVDLSHELEKSMREGAQAYDDGRMEDVQSANLRSAVWSEKLAELEKATKGAGTELGRGLVARKAMMNEDFSLAAMEQKARAAKGFAPLTDTERQQLVELKNQIDATQKAHDDYVAQTQERISKLEATKTIEDIKREPSLIPPKVLEIANKLVEKWDREANDSRAKLKAIFGRTSAGVDPAILYHVARVGRSYLGHAALDFVQWSDKMVSEFGEGVKPYLKDAFDKTNALIAQEKMENPIETMRQMRSKSPEEQIKANAEKIGEKVAAGKKEDITWYVQRIARLLVQSGVTDRDALIDRVHDVLKEHMPEITRRETMDAISGYGDFKQLSKDDISVQLRGLKGEMQQLAKLEDMAKGEPPLKSGVERRTQTEAERQLIKKVNEAKFAFQVPMTDPATQLKSALDTYKTSLKNRTADLQARLDKRDFAKRPRRQLELDREAMRLKAENERVKQEFQKGLTRERLKQRTPWEKTMDTVVKWRRGFILSGPVTLAKLTSAAVARAFITPIEEAVGAGLAHVPGLSQVAEKAPREGGASVTAEVKSITEGITHGMADAWKTLRTGKSDLDVLFGKDKGLPQSFIDIFGNIHGALKAPVKRAEFARSFQKRAEFYARQNVDVTDPFVQTKIGLEAYQDANRAIFMQRNMLNDAYKRLLSRFDEADKTTGKPTVAGKVAGTTARVLLPIVKVPTNIVAETMQYAIGSVTGSVRLAKAFHDGIATLKPEEADLIMRHLKKGSLGAAVMLTAFLNPQMLGGFYQQGEKRAKEDIKPDAARIGGVDIPSSVIHNPWMGAAQIGATVRRVADSKLHKKDSETQGLSHGALAGAFGLAEATPFVREMLEVGKAFTPSQRDQWLGELAKSMVVPQAVQSAAQAMDKDEQGNPVKRKPTSTLQAIESGVPGLRKNVPVAKK